MPAVGEVKSEDMAETLVHNRYDGVLSELSGFREATEEIPWGARRYRAAGAICVRYQAITFDTLVNHNFSGANPSDSFCILVRK